MSASLDPNELAEERDFLLASLDDLEREHDAGDIDDEDYAALRDDYTARAARVLRALEVGSATEAPAPVRNRARGLLVLTAVIGFAVLAGVLVAQSVGRRDAGDVATGGIRQSITERLNEAQRRLGQQDLEGAIGVYDEVLDLDPDNAEALTYKGWALYLSGDAESVRLLASAVRADPEYPDAHAFLAVVLFRGAGLADQAAEQIAQLDALDPPAIMRELVEPLRAQIAAAQAAAPTTSSSTTVADR